MGARYVRARTFSGLFSCLALLRALDMGHGDLAFLDGAPFFFLHVTKGFALVNSMFCVRAALFLSLFGFLLLTECCLDDVLGLTAAFVPLAFIGHLI